MTHVTTWLNSHVILQIEIPHYKFVGHTLCKSINVTIKTTINFYHTTTLLYLVIKEKFAYICVIGQYFVWVVVSEALFWVSVGYFGWVGHYLGWVGVSEGVRGIILGRWGWVGVNWALFWVGGSGWENILDEWGWVGMSEGEWG